MIRLSACGSYMTRGAVADASDLGLACVLVANLVQIIRTVVACAAMHSMGTRCGYENAQYDEQRVSHWPPHNCENCR